MTSGTFNIVKSVGTIDSNSFHLKGPGGESLCNNFELTAAGYSQTFYFNEGLINDGEPFKVCVTFLGADSKNCVDGLNHLGRHSESVFMNAPNIISKP
jgi:hypothetical protein